jgi:hypothetical protein
MIADFLAQPGDVLVGRECWAMLCDEADTLCFCEDDAHHHAVYRADTGDECPGGWSRKDANEAHITARWRSSATMPRWAARIVRPVLSVRVERLQDIDEADAVREGATEPFKIMGGAPFSIWIRAARLLWDARYAKRGIGWDVNPWCWVVEFGAPA